MVTTGTMATDTTATSTTATSTTATGLRERKKAATRQALHEAALRLAVEHGLDRLTVEAIADAAMVSRRTFSNYFSSKEEALVYGDLVRLRRLIELVRTRPADEPPWTALSRAAERLVAESPDLDSSWRTQHGPLRRHPALVVQQLAMYAAIERDLADEITARIPDDPDVPMRSRVLAATFLTALRVATRQWLEDPTQATLLDLVHRALEYAAGR